uniref:Uncharacterized protein n=1 Tax=Rhizophora mucronata TaxID=61149 RepID=A0A2P2QWI4_RHIMU
MDPPFCVGDDDDSLCRLWSVCVPKFSSDYAKWLCNCICFYFGFRITGIAGCFASDRTLI